MVFGILLYLNNMWYGIKQILQLGKPIITDSTLAAKVVMIGRYKLVKRHVVLITVLEEIDNLQTELFCVLCLLWSLF